MWSRSLIKKETLEKYNAYAITSGLKMWLVYERALEALLEKDQIKKETLEKYNAYAAKYGLEMGMVYERALEALLEKDEQRE